MCLAFPGKIVSISGNHALADFEGIKKKINISLLDAAAKGDYVIVHAGFAIEKLTNEDAWEVLRVYEQGWKKAKIAKKNP